MRFVRKTSTCVINYLYSHCLQWWPLNTSHWIRDLDDFLPFWFLRFTYFVFQYIFNLRRNSFRFLILFNFGNSIWNHKKCKTWQSLGAINIFKKIHFVNFPDNLIKKIRYSLKIKKKGKSNRKKLKRKEKIDNLFENNNLSNNSLNEKMNFFKFHINN